MRLLLASLAVVGLLGVGATVAADPDHDGTLVWVPVKAGTKPVEATVGDLLQFEVSYPVVPDKLVSGLKVEVSGKGLTRIATLSVPKRTETGQQVMGVGAVAAFVRADQAGEYTVSVVPRLAGGKDGAKVEVKVKVAGK